MNIGERLRKLRGDKSQAEFGENVGTSQPTIRNYENNIRKPDSDFIKNVCNKYGVSADWLLFGITTEKTMQKTADAVSFEGQHTENIKPQKTKTAGIGGFLDPNSVNEPRGGYGDFLKRLPQNPPSTIIYTKDFTGEESDCTMGLVPLVQARLSAGHGSFEAEETIESWYAFRMEFLRRRGQPSQMVLMRVAGNSMAPNIRNGDVVLIDQSQKDIQAGQIYAVGVEDLIYLKLIDTRPGVMVLTSINPKYQPIEVPVSDSLARPVPILGRCIWSCHEW